MKRSLTAASLFSLLSLISVNASTHETTEPCQSSADGYFGWQFETACHAKVRGGTSKGGPVKLASQPYEGFQAIQQSYPLVKQQDISAILAMTGTYRVGFDFMEIALYVENAQLAIPYRSWGTEYVHVVEQSDNFISLQHTMVMVFEDENGELSEPMVMKHWRQDWQYEPTSILVYKGRDTWALEPLTEQQRQGMWSQTVYQVDDSPRYGGYGKWQHTPTVSMWESSQTHRPLPRRESSVRDDYDVLIGNNTHSILPNGWLHEEENYKAILGEIDDPKNVTKYIAKELGLARYESIADYNISSGLDYWQQTGPFWKLVRAQWKALFQKHKEVKVKRYTDKGTPMFVEFFKLAESLDVQNDQAGAKQKVSNAILRYAQPLETQ